MRNKVLHTIEKYNMLNKGDSVIIALSGGADSVSLFHVILSIKELYSLNVFAAHVNHNLRGAESERDENFVRELCKNHNVPIFVKSVDIASLSEKQKISEELCGRNVRYEFFSQLADEKNAKILTAHTADDSCETLIYNIARGTSLNGLCGIPAIRGNIYRPLIEVTSKQIREYCKSNNFSYVTDSSNLTDEYTRNKIRHNVIPVLTEINQSFIAGSVDFFGRMREINEYFEKIAYENLLKCTCKNGYSCDMLKKVPKALLSQMIALIINQSGAEADSRHIKLCIDIIQNGGAVCLKNGKKAVSSQGVFRITDESNCISELEPVRLNSELEILYNAKRYFFEKKSFDKSIVNDNNCFDSSFVTEDTVVRTRKEGDTFTLPNRCVTKSLKKLFIELKIPREKRNSILLVANGNDVLWIEGIGASHNARVTKKTKELFLIDIKEK